MAFSSRTAAAWRTQLASPAAAECAATDQGAHVLGVQQSSTLGSSPAKKQQHTAHLWRRGLQKLSNQQKRPPGPGSGLVRPGLLSTGLQSACSTCACLPAQAGPGAGAGQGAAHSTAACRAGPRRDCTGCQARRARAPPCRMGLLPSRTMARTPLAGWSARAASKAGAWALQSPLACSQARTPGHRAASTAQPAWHSSPG